MSATAEIINTSSARGTAALTLKVNPSRLICVNVSTEICEDLLGRIAFSPKLDFGSIVESVEPLSFYGAKTDTRTAFHPFFKRREVSAVVKELLRCVRDFLIGERKLVFH